jgi:hypothetical protein
MGRVALYIWPTGTKDYTKTDFGLLRVIKLVFRTPIQEIKTAKE